MTPVNVDGVTLQEGDRILITGLADDAPDKIIRFGVDEPTGPLEASQPSILGDEWTAQE